MTRLALLALMALAGCVGTSHLDSEGDVPTTLDGQLADWAALTSVRDGLRLGARDDGHRLTLAVEVSDPALVRQATAGGLVVWLSGEGAARRAGVRYPLRGDSASAEFDRLAVRVGETGEVERPARSAGGPQAAGSIRTGTLAVELRVPLGGDAFPVSVGADGTLWVGLSAEPPVHREGGPRGAGRPPGGARPDGPPPGGPPPGRLPAGGPPPGPPGDEGTTGRTPTPDVSWVRIALADG